MSKKSKTQMTKAELIDLAYTLENKVKELEEQIETMQNDRIALDTIIADQDTSMIISGMNARIKMLEDKILDVESRKNYE
tara:strand:- start:47369 stop:47608 length:240 start_codon:yes stop_codon:yes gene_type:complete